MSEGDVRLIEIRLARSGAAGPVLALLTVAAPDPGGVPFLDPGRLDDELLTAEVTTFAADVAYRGAGGETQVLPRPARTPVGVVLVGLGPGAEDGWRSAGAALVRTAQARWTAVDVAVPAGATAADVRAFAEGATLASYRFRLGPEDPAEAPRLRRLDLVTTLPPDEVRAALAAATAVTDAVVLARDLTNTPSREKSPAWFADRLAAAAARRSGVEVTVRTRDELARDGFGGILAVGAGSTRPPRLVELAWRPPTRRGHPRPLHVVLVGKGITFDTGGISLKPLEGMKLMRKDMAGAAAVAATVLAAADLGLPVRITALAAVAENLVSGSAYRPGDVITHYGGSTTEVHNTDAEGRLVLADALAYAERRLRPDVLLDLATLTGAGQVALGKRIAAILSPDAALVHALRTAGEQVGERVWPMPLADDYTGALASDVADRINAPQGGAGLITAALFLRDFTGSARPHWVHIDMSGPSWIEAAEGPLTRGATGWGVRLLVRWLSTL